jgi:hypothetical protein
MKPIKYKDTGAAVEDIQRRLRVLGYDIGSEGLDANFGEQTRAAVEAFQNSNGIAGTGAVGPRTWSALVDSTFELGDRMLYLRMPHFHGADVKQLQNALNTLGFVAGGADGIYGAGTERAVAELQGNYGITPDGIAGVDTFRALFDLRHIWGGKDGLAHSSTQGLSSVRNHFRILLEVYFEFEAGLRECVHSPEKAAYAAASPDERPSDATPRPALRRLARFANNLEEGARADVIASGEADDEPPIIINTQLCAYDGPAVLRDESVKIVEDIIIFHEKHRMMAAAVKSYCDDYLATHGKQPKQIHIGIPIEVMDGRSQSRHPLALQHTASRILDALCEAAIDGAFNS